MEAFKAAKNCFSSSAKDRSGDSMRNFWLGTVNSMPLVISLGARDISKVPDRLPFVMSQSKIQTVEDDISAENVTPMDVARGFISLMVVILEKFSENF